MTVQNADEFDYIIVGGGTAGCVLASRLTEDPNVSVLLLEAGGEGKSRWVSIPAGFYKIMNRPDFNWRFQSEPEESVLGRTIAIPRGKGLGGSTLINGMIYTRGQPEDFDQWENSGNSGWNFASVLPYFKKLESFASGDPELRGRSGPLNLVTVSERNPIAESFLSAAQEAGFSLNPDYNGKTQEGFGYYQVNQKNGRRWNAADAYLSVARSRKNLTVRTNAHATKVELQQGRAVGVHYHHKGCASFARAVCEVVFAAGAIQSPHLLELSGIGDPVVLAAAGVETKVARPGVGRNYYDHFATRMSWRVKMPITLNELSRGRHLVKAVAQYYAQKKGILTLGTGLVHGFIKAHRTAERPDVQLFFVHASFANAADRRLDRLPGMTCGLCQMRPESVGTIHLKSSDPFAPPSIRPNFLSSTLDQETLIEGMRIMREIAGQPALDAIRGHENSPGETIQTDEEFLDFARSTGQTVYHPVGTCRMGLDPLAVVDERLRVHGVQGLRVVDASVMPRIVSGNTQAAVLMIAEKAADLLKADRKSLSSVVPFR